MFYQEVNSNHSGYHDIRISHNFVYGSHCHDDFELVYSLAGTTELTVNGQSFLVRSGEWAMVLNNPIPSYESVSRYGNAESEAERRLCYPSHTGCNARCFRNVDGSGRRDRFLRSQQRWLLR